MAYIFFPLSETVDNQVSISLCLTASFPQLSNMPTAHIAICPLGTLYVAMTLILYLKILRAVSVIKPDRPTAASSVTRVCGAIHMGELPRRGYHVKWHATMTSEQPALNMQRMLSMTS